MADKHETAQDEVDVIREALTTRTYSYGVDKGWVDANNELALEALAALAAREQTLRQALEGIEHLVRHEWRLKDHSPVLVLNTIEQELDALAADAPAPEQACWCSEDGITPKRGHADDHLLDDPAPEETETLAALRQLDRVHARLIASVTPSHAGWLDKSTPEGKDEYDSLFSTWHSATRRCRRLLGPNLHAEPNAAPEESLLSEDHSEIRLVDADVRDVWTRRAGKTPYTLEDYEHDKKIREQRAAPEETQT